MMRILYLCVFRIDFGYISLCLGNGTIKNKWKATLQCQSGGVERLATKKRHLLFKKKEKYNRNQCEIHTNTKYAPF